MSRKLGPISFDDGAEQVFLGRDFARRRTMSERTLETIDDEVAIIVHQQLERARAILHEFHDKVEVMAEALLERETLNRADIKLIMTGQPLPPPVVLPPPAEPRTGDDSADDSHDDPSSAPEPAAIADAAPAPPADPDRPGVLSAPPAGPAPSAFAAPTWRLGERRLAPPGRPLVMGVLNLTPDSFFPASRQDDPGPAVAAALRLLDEGADILDLGAVSSRPGALPVPAAEEQARLLPTLRALRPLTDRPLTVDTSRAATARLALDAGADGINDITAGLGDPGLLPLAAERGCGLVLMHMQGTPGPCRTTRATSTQRPRCAAFWPTGSPSPVRPAWPATGSPWTPASASASVWRTI